MKNTPAHFDPFVNQILDDEEQQLEEDFEKGEYEISSRNLEETKNVLRDAALRYKELQNTKPVTIRVNQLDLIKLKTRAKVKNIPYQTLIGALIHQYAEGETQFSV